MKRAVGTLSIILGFILIFSIESVSLEKPILKLNAPSLENSAYKMLVLENLEKQTHIRIENPMKQTWIGLDTVLIGRLRRDEEGKLESILGMSAGIGIAYRRYFKTAEEFRALHPYWELGTMILLWPYGTLGVTYPIPLGSEEKKIGSLFCLDLYVGLIFPFPFAGIGLAVAF